MPKRGLSPSASANEASAKRAKETHVGHAPPTGAENIVDSSQSRTTHNSEKRSTGTESESHAEHASRLVAESASTSGQTSTNANRGSEPVVISKDLRSYFTTAVAKRLTGFANVCLPNSKCYAVSHWPDNIDWGRRKDGRDDMSQYLCVDNAPALIWIVAELQKAIFRDSGGRSARCPTVRVRPLLQADLKTCVNKLYTLSNPSISLKDTSSFTIKKWVVGRNEPESNVTDFSECYDATASYKERDPVPCYSFNEGDIVLVEAFVHRYRNWDVIKEKGASNSTNTWSYWVTEFELSALNLLVKAPKEDVVRKVDDFDL